MLYTKDAIVFALYRLGSSSPSSGRKLLLVPNKDMVVRVTDELFILNAQSHF